MHRFLLAISLLLLSACAFGQQDFVARYDAFAGYSYLDAHTINLSERGYHVQAAVNTRTWLALGFDYSHFTGHSTLLPKFAPTALQNQLNGQIGQLIAAGLLPPSYQLFVPFDSGTQTFAAGPQFSYRHYKHVTLFIRPSFGAIRETATPKPHDFVTNLVVQQLAPRGTKLDWTGFYGLGGGVELKAGRHLGLTLQADYVRDHLFNDLLKDARNTVRLSIGPNFHFGRNIVK